MPNHVINEVVLHSVGLKQAEKFLLNADGLLSFEVLLPLPLHFWAGSVSRDHELAFPGTHLNAAREVWGTKWDAYGEPTCEEIGTDVIIRFKTAWNHPRGWVCAVLNTLKCNITVLWLSEGGEAAHLEKYVWNNSGLIGGPSWCQEEIEDGSCEHRRLHKLLWGVESFEEESE